MTTAQLEDHFQAHWPKIRTGWRKCANPYSGWKAGFAAIPEMFLAALA
jgi:hypothetical protein